MKKLLLFVIAFTCVSIGARAEGEADGYLFGTDTWRSYTDNESAVTIQLTKSGVLAAAINEINNGAAINGKPLKDCDIVYISGESIGDADLAALSDLNYQTIVLEDVTWAATSKSFSNVNVKYLVLPKGWTKSEVNAIGLTLSSSENFASCVSSDDFSENVCYDGDISVKNGHSVTAYVHKGNTLETTIHHTYLDNKPSLLGISQYSGKHSNIFEVTISGYPVARDIFSAELDYTKDGHIVFNEPADETKYGPDDYNIGISGNVRVAVGDGIKEYGALQNTEVVHLDLSDAVIEPQWIDDLNLSISGLIGRNTKRVDIPINPIVDTLPADFLNADAPYITQIYIPGNIKYIKARAFQHIHLYHVWTSPIDGTITDNGVVTGFDENDNEIRKYGYLPYNACDILYGSITLPRYLELIESGAFQSATEIKDVYSLNPEAPDCHVDAFNTLEYVANDHYNSSSITNEGIITRDAYRNGGTWKWMTILHYPRETVAPDIQRYTDPTRRYSIASGDKDGNGATIYYPNQSEYCRSYLQATTGLLWNAWDTTREDYNNGFGNTTIESDLSKTVGYTDERQDAANAAYEANQLGLDTKKLTSFYDVTEGGKVSQPNGLVPYSTVYWDEASYSLNTEGRGVPLYPAAKYSEEYFKYEPVSDPSTFTGTMYEKVGDDYVEVAGDIEEGKTYYSRVQTQAINEDGTLKYEACTDGTFVEDTRYDEDNNGIYVENYIVASDGNLVQDSEIEPKSDGNLVKDMQENASGTLVKDYEWTEATDGVYYHPLIKETEKDQTNPSQYYYYEPSNTYVEDPNGEYIDANEFDPYQSAYYATISTLKGWGWTDEKIASYTHYSPAGGTWKQVTTTTEMYQHDVYKISSDYKVWTESANDYESTINSTRYNKTVLSPVVYRDYSEATDYTLDASGNKVTDTRYTENGYKAYDAATDDGSQRYGEVLQGTFHAYNETTDAGKTRYNKGEGYREAVDNESDNALQHYSYVTYYREVAEGETGTYCPVMVDAVFRDLLKKNDYRGWHQFVMAANATNSDVPFEPLKSFITDNDWWTICVPYDLTYSDMVYLFGDKKNNKIPYLSKLVYVVRDVANRHVTLMFSKNLMVYKEQFLEANGEVTNHEQFPDADGNIYGRVHGYIDETDKGKWSSEEIARDPVILHAGVPYMIRPEIPDGGSRQFDIYRHDQLSQEAQAALKPNAIVSDGLWKRLNAAKNLSGNEQKELVYNGEYQVPAYVINNLTTGGEETKGNANSPITMNDGSTFTYTPMNGDDETEQFLFNGKRYKMEISDKYDYTFVGSFYLSLMPQYSYFLGWNKATKKAQFWYNKVNDIRNWTWNNETGIICANWDLEKEIEAADGEKFLPARWVAAGGTDLADDDFTVSSSAGNVKGYLPMTFGNGMRILVGGQDIEDVVSDDAGIPDAINNVNDSNTDTEWYNVNGQKLNGKPISNGVYIKSGKKYVVK